MERVLVPAELPRLLRAVHLALVEHRDEVDALNVFPVPDGDTGTNLAATAAAVVDAIPADGSGLTRAALRSARGNSGVIFSQIVRAVIEAIEDPEAVDDVDVLARGLLRADGLARQAVADPVEGTILTAVRAAAVVAAEARDQGRSDLGGVLDDVRHAVADAVRATRDQLEVLRDAGVVDAGARGFEVVVAAIQAVATGEAVHPEALDNIVPRCVPGQQAAIEANPIEVQFVVPGGDDVAASIRDRLVELGDSVVVVVADGLVQAHVHTADPDAAVAVGTEVGNLENVRVTDLRPPQGDDPPPALSIVAVLPAGGLADLGEAAGAAVVPGAAGALPSVEELLLAARSTRSDRVVVLPGHANVVPTARQAAALAADEENRLTLEVIESATHPLVVLSCLALQTTDADAMHEIATGAASGEVVAAVRDATLDDIDVLAGQPLAVVDGRVIASGDRADDMLRALLSHLGASSAELVTIAVGADCTLDAGEVMMAALVEVGEAEVDVLDGGQRPALLLVSVEA